METAHQRCLRIVGALEDLVAQEAVALASRNYGEMSSLQDRAAPLVDFLANNGATDTDDAVMRDRIAAVRQLRVRSAAQLASDVEQARAELRGSEQTQRQVAKIAPAYVLSSPSRAKLCIVG